VCANPSQEKEIQKITKIKKKKSQVLKFITTPSILLQSPPNHHHCHRQTLRFPTTLRNPPPTLPPRRQFVPERKARSHCHTLVNQHRARDPGGARRVQNGAVRKGGVGLRGFRKKKWIKYGHFWAIFGVI
jgi:hypothetical protein